MDEPFDSTTFFFELPVYACFQKGTDGNIPKIRNMPDGRTCVAVFTDSAGASQFVAERGEETATEILPFRSHAALVNWLTWCQRNGVTSVVFDDGGKAGSARRVIAIPKLLRILEQLPTGKGRAIMSILLERLNAETQLVAEPLKRLEERVLAGAIAICKDLPAHARQANEDLWRAVKAGEADRFQEMGQQFLEVLDKIIGVLKPVVETVELPLHDELAEVERLRQEHLDQWPWVRPEEFDQARAEAARGETTDMDDAFAAIAGVSREEWERRLEARQGSKCSQEGK